VGTPGPMMVPPWAVMSVSRAEGLPMVMLHDPFYDLFDDRFDDPSPRG
jgi:hypothetical protein